MTNKDILNTAMHQSAVDLACAPEDFLTDTNKIVISKKNQGARKYLKLPFECNLVSYGNNIVASVREDVAGVIENYIEKYPVEHCFETPNMNVLNAALAKYDLKICFMAEYFLPDITLLKKHDCKYETRILHQSDFADLYKPEWSNVLCEKRKELDVLGVGAYDGGKLIGLAACSADCDSMWQIGIDVLPEYPHTTYAPACKPETLSSGSTVIPYFRERCTFPETSLNQPAEAPPFFSPLICSCAAFQRI